MNCRLWMPMHFFIRIPSKLSIQSTYWQFCLIAMGGRTNCMLSMFDTHVHRAMGIDFRILGNPGKNLRKIGVSVFCPSRCQLWIFASNITTTAQLTLPRLLCKPWSPMQDDPRELVPPKAINFHCFGTEQGDLQCQLLTKNAQEVFLVN